jgi:hypothetical protein
MFDEVVVGLVRIDIPSKLLWITVGHDLICLRRCDRESLRGRERGGRLFVFIPKLMCVIADGLEWRDHAALEACEEGKDGYGAELLR